MQPPDQGSLDKEGEPCCFQGWGGGIWILAQQAASLSVCVCMYERERETETDCVPGNATPLVKTP